MPSRVKVQGDLYHGTVPPGAVYVGRPAPGLKASPYANPFSTRQYDLATVQRLFRAHLAHHPGLIARARVDLAGWDICCWCPPDALWCHGTDWLVLAGGGELADLSPLLEASTP